MVRSALSKTHLRLHPRGFVGVFFQPHDSGNRIAESINKIVFICHLVVLAASEILVFGGSRFSVGTIDLCGLWLKYHRNPIDLG